MKNLHSCLTTLNEARIQLSVLMLIERLKLNMINCYHA